MTVSELAASWLAILRQHRSTLAILLTGAGVTLVGPARSDSSPVEGPDSPPRRFDLHYTAPSQCPSREDFLDWTNRFYWSSAESAAASSDADAADWHGSPGELAGSVRVKVVQTGGRFVAHLLMVEADGRCATSRPPHSETECGDAVRAMAFSLAAALKAPPCHEQIAASTGAPNPCPPVENPPPSTVQQCPASKPYPPPRQEGTEGEVGVGVGGMGLVADSLAYGGALFVGLRHRGWGMSGRLAAGHWDAGAVPLGHDLEARLWSLSVSLCPVQLDLSRFFVVPLCASGELGYVALSGFGAAEQSGSGLEAEDANAVADDGDHANLYLWSSLGLAAPLRFHSSWFFAELAPTFAFPLLRHPVYEHQPSSASTEQELSGRVAQWFVVKAQVNVGLVIP